MERRKARIQAAEILYGKEITKNGVTEIVENRNLADPRFVPLPFALELVDGVLDHTVEIDKVINEYAEDWTVARMPSMDRNVLRIGVFEMIYREDIPVSVVINESIELAKRFGTEESAKFVNGVLGKIALNEALLKKRKAAL